MQYEFHRTDSSSETFPTFIPNLTKILRCALTLFQRVGGRRRGACAWPWVRLRGIGRQLCLAGPAGEGCGEERGEVRGKYLFARLKVKEGVSEGGGGIYRHRVWEADDDGPLWLFWDKRQRRAEGTRLKIHRQITYLVLNEPMISVTAMMADRQALTKDLDGGKKSGQKIYHQN